MYWADVGKRKRPAASPRSGHNFIVLAAGITSFVFSLTILWPISQRNKGKVLTGPENGRKDKEVIL
jgi:hypothetical protein